MALSHRLEIRIDEERLELLREAARKSRRAIGAVIREAIDCQLKQQVVSRRLKAVEELARVAAPIGTPAQMKEEILEGYLCETESFHRRKRPHVRRGNR